MSSSNVDDSKTLTVHKTAKVKLYPNKTQQGFFPEVFGLCNAVYNLCLEQDRTYFGKKNLFTKTHHIFSTDRSFSLDTLHNKYMVHHRRHYGADRYQQQLELTQLKEAFPYFKIAPNCALQNAIRRYHQARSKMFDDYKHGRSDHIVLHFRKKNKDKSFDINQDKFSLEINEKNNTTGKLSIPNLSKYVARKLDETSSLPKKIKRKDKDALGMVKFRGLNLPKGAKITKLTVKEDKIGDLYGTISYSLVIPEPTDRMNDDPLGIDRNVDNLCVDSNGNIVESDKFFAKALPKIKEKQRKLSRQIEAQEAKEKKELERLKKLKETDASIVVPKRVRLKESNRRKKTRKELAKLHLNVTRKRDDSLHKTTTKIANSHGVVVMEDLRIANMTRSNEGTVEEPGKNRAQKRGLNRAILEQGWGKMKDMLRYKLAYSGGILGFVNPQYTSQTCSMCFHVSKKNRVTRDRFKCESCGYEAHADHNASVNIKTRWGTTDENTGGKVFFSVSREVFRVAEFA